MERTLWKNHNYRVTFDDKTSELIYRIKIPLKKFRETISRKKLRGIA